MTNMKQTEQGRSMVEMLGVLAIIGVLSIGGIAGYTMAMNRHRANELMDGASKRAIVAMQQISLGTEPGDVSLAEFTSNIVPGGTFSGTVLDVEGGEVGIQVSGIEKPVCELLANMSNDSVSVTKVISSTEVQEMEAEDCSDSENALVFLFNLNSGSGSGTGDDDSAGNCWVRGDCTADDIDSNYAAFCGGKVHGITYCECLSEGFPDPSMDCSDTYPDCRKEGNSKWYCECILRNYDLMNEDEYVCRYGENCIKSGGTPTCCECMMIIGNEEECQEYGDCP